MRKVTCQFSSKYFSGFKVSDIDLSDLQNLNEIVDICRASLLNVLTQHNFEILIQKAQKTKFHIHQPQSLEQAKANPREIIWICDHDDE